MEEKQRKKKKQKNPLVERRDPCKQKREKQNKTKQNKTKKKRKTRTTEALADSQETLLASICFK